MIKLGKPFIEGNRLCMWMNEKDEKRMIWYEVEEKYVKYFCTERIDGFVVTLLLYAMKNGQDIECECPISEKLYYQLVNFLIPTLAKNIEEYKSIKINAVKDSATLTSNSAVGTGISLGVDSFYTLLSNIKNETTNFNITHLTCFNVGGNGSYGGEKARKLFNERKENGKEFSQKNNFEFVSVDSNISEIINMVNLETHSFRQMAVPLLLQKLFSKYYYSSGYDFNSFKIDKSSSAHFDLLNVHCFSNENIDFYSTGGELSRMEKMKYISEFNETYDYLNVCTQEGKNCSKCTKCIRTMLELYSINQLEKYKNVFDIENFYKTINWKLGDIFKYSDKLYYREIYANIKKNNIKIPIQSYVIGYLKRIKRIFSREGKK